MLKRLKPLGASDQELLDVYDKQIRCILEYASPVWTPGLTQAILILMKGLFFKSGGKGHGTIVLCAIKRIAQNQILGSAPIINSG